MHVRGASCVLPASQPSRAGVLRTGKSHLLQAWTKLVWTMQASIRAISQGQQGAVLDTVCWGQGRAVPSWGANGTWPRLTPQRTLLPLTRSWTPRNPAAVVAHAPHLSMPGLSSFSVPAGSESGAASGAGTTRAKLTHVSTKDSMRWNMKSPTSLRHDSFFS